MEEKINLIKQIVQFHPGLGTDKGWSWYEGGMRDSGGWYWERMIEKENNELENFLRYLQNWKKDSDEQNRKNLEEYQRVQVLTEEERKLYHREWSEKIKKMWEEFGQEMDRRLMWGK